ncbi:hypothetical protein EV664_101194 [Stakelama pacifica]|uniref:Uncharacterized protein n=2 Tax=Stakelama pacifica TaxID=517720 RepID=A0A4R6FZ15_9SPHN|nr:hypothetical protein EV664_101194 [Stakelama pacifica]GGO90184.1 hypothetical protein GCM10011329_01900 [Stakelama pacifica]
MIKMAGASFILALTVPAFVPAAHADDHDRAAYYMHSFAKCVVRGDKDSVAALLNEKPGSAEANAAMQAIGKRRSGCLKVVGGGGKLKMNSASMRGALAEQLYTDEFSSPPDAPVQGEQPIPFQGSGDPDLVSYDVAACMATRDPVDTDSFVRTDVKSEAEKAALSKLAPTLANCVPTGTKLGFDRELLHGMAAEALWKMRKGVSSGPAAGQKLD